MPSERIVTEMRPLRLRLFPFSKSNHTHGYLVTPPQDFHSSYITGTGIRGLKDMNKKQEAPMAYQSIITFVILNGHQHS